MRRTIKGNNGVSPVIAVILMVAITVVLSGVVFLWAQSFTDETEQSPDYYNVEVTLTTDEGAPPSQIITVELNEGIIEWNTFEVRIDDLILAQAVGKHYAGDIQTFTVPYLAVGGMDLSVGTSYLIKIISLDFNKIVYNNEIICVREI